MSEDKFFRVKPTTKNQARALRKGQTKTEKLLWAALQGRKLDGYKFRRQHPIGKYIVDFYCAEVCLVIEVDGDVHALQKNLEKDKIRAIWLKEQGYSIIRVTYFDVIENLEGVAEKLLSEIEYLKKAHDNG